MSNEPTPEFVGLIIGTIVVVIGLGSMFMVSPMADKDTPPLYRRVGKKWATILIATYATAWLWMPWVCLGVYSLSNINTSLAAHVRRPDQVTPVPPRTYRADEAPAVEKP